jgi:hypothetical protein
MPFLKLTLIGVCPTDSEPASGVLRLHVPHANLPCLLVRVLMPRIQLARLVKLV